MIAYSLQKEEHISLGEKNESEKRVLREQKAQKSVITLEFWFYSAWLGMECVKEYREIRSPFPAVR